MYECLEPVNQPGMERSLKRVWFPAVTSMEEADAVDDVLDRSLRGLRGLQSQVAASIDMCATVAASEQSRQLDRLQVILAAIGAFLLWPALVFSFFGANTELPGRDEIEGLVIMVVATLIGTALLLAGIPLARRRRRGNPPRERPNRN